MKTIITFLAGVACAATVSAINIESGKAYRIVCNYTPNGTLCLGQPHGSLTYLYHNPYYDGKCEDAWWYFKQQADGSYLIYNADTHQIITYTTDRINGVCKGLMLTDDDQGDISHWFVTEVSGDACVIYTENAGAQEKGDAFWNLRTDGTNLLGTYAYSTTQNALFRITDEKYVTPDPGPDPTPEPEPEPEVEKYEVLDGGSDVFVVGQTGNRLTVIPKGYVKDVALNDNSVRFTLADDCYVPSDENDGTIEFSQVTFLDENAFPAGMEMPSFTSYKFNNKFNYQLPDAVEASDPAASKIRMSVGGIGKWLTASFKLSDDEAVAYVGECLQESKVTRQRFDDTVTYTVGYKAWRQLEVRQYEPKSDAAAATDADLRVAYVPYGRQQAVRVTWLTERSKNEYDVPRIDITLTDHRDAFWGDPSYAWGAEEYFWLGQNGKSTYENAEIMISGGGVFPDMPPTPILIKGRGNSTWRSTPEDKNPYHFKFESAQKPLGLTKGKHWVLLSNKQTGSMTTNAIGHRVADMMGGAAPCHIIPVELYINDSYRGSYNLCEKVGFGNNSVDIEDETYAAMVELDTYTDETIYRDDWYYVATKMKHPDFDDDYQGRLTPEMVMGDWNNMLEQAFLEEDVSAYIDTERAAAYLAANEMIANCELKHAKSVYAYSENVGDGFSIEANGDATPWVLGPLWDCDWAFGYEQTVSNWNVSAYERYFTRSQNGDFFSKLIDGGESSGRAQQMWKAILGNRKVNRAYYYKWYDFYHNRLPELLDFCDEYYAFAAKSLAHNEENETKHRDGTDYAKSTGQAKQWLRERAEYVFSHLKSYPLPEEPVEPAPVYDDPTSPVEGELAAMLLGIESVVQDGTAAAGGRYDLLGRRAAGNYRGISVEHNRKVKK